MPGEPEYRIPPEVAAARRAPQPWRDKASCQRHDPSYFDGTATGAQERLAAEFCREVCPVVTECLTHALDADERFGVWGGTTESQRARLLKTRRAAAIRPLARYEGGEAQR